MITRSVLPILLFISILLVGVESVRASDAVATCAALSRSAPGYAAVSESTWQPAGSVVVAGMGGLQTVAVPPHCLLRGVIGARVGVGGRHYGIGFEMRLPRNWNGRFLFQGGGGLDGAVLPALGIIGGGPTGLQRGFAVMSMDGGHEGRDASFGIDQQARLDFAYLALARSVDVGKDVIDRFYDRPPTRSYFVGCSNGGREAMMAADRMPLAFDGIVAGDPGLRLSHAAIAEAWNTAQLTAVAPPDASGKPDLPAALTDADLSLLANAVRDACDGLDGLRDGLIEDPAQCHFSPHSLLCAPGQASGCLSAAKLAAVEAVFGGAHDSSGRPLYSGFPYDTGIDQPGWRVWMLGVAQAMPALNATLGANSLRLYFMTPPAPTLDVSRLDYDRVAAGVEQTAAINDPTATLLTSFAGHGGKLLIYQGNSDPVFSANDITAWYRSLAAPSGYARLFLVAGMNHCRGGRATDSFDALAAVQAWAEQGVAPERIIATGAALPGVSRPLCAYPAYARFRAGDPRLAASFVCTLPAPEVTKQ